MVETETEDLGMCRRNYTNTTRRSRNLIACGQHGGTVCWAFLRTQSCWWVSIICPQSLLIDNVSNPVVDESGMQETNRGSWWCHLVGNTCRHNIGILYVTVRT